MGLHSRELSLKLWGTADNRSVYWKFTTMLKGSHVSVLEHQAETCLNSWGL